MAVARTPVDPLLGAESHDDGIVDALTPVWSEGPLPQTAVASAALSVRAAAGPAQSVTPLAVETDSRMARLSADIQLKLATLSDFPAFDLVEHHHTCSCIGCSTDREEPTDNGEAMTGTSTGTMGTMDEMANFLLRGYWNTGSGDGTRSHNVTNSGYDPNNGVLHYNLSGYADDADGVTEARADLIRGAFKLFEATLGITFVETTSTDRDEVDFFFRDNDGGAYASHGYRNSGTWGSTITSTDINIAKSWSGGTSTYDDYTLQTILHEIGHALGLGHQGPYNGSATYGTSNIYDNDSWQASMMSYFSQGDATAVTASTEFLQTPMVVDWIALDEIYGRQGYGVSNAFTEDTVWGFNTTVTSDVSDIWATWSDWADRTASTIVDGGGIDTLDLSGYNDNTLINLAPSDLDATAPSTSDIGGRIGNLTIAVGTIIENAIGGSGAEVFYGNNADNTLTGNDGDDTFHDSAGNDRYVGGNGEDTTVFALRFVDYTYTLISGALQVIGVDTDWVESTVEWIRFSDQTLSWQAVAASVGPNDAPVARRDDYTVEEGQALTTGNVLDNDTDADGHSLSVSRIEGLAVATDGTTAALASGAFVTMLADGSFIYDQNGAFGDLDTGQTGTDTFSYTVSDGKGGLDTAEVVVTINGVTQMLVAENRLLDFENETPGSLVSDGDLIVAGLDVVESQRLSGAQLAQAGSDAVFSITTTGEDFDLSALSLVSLTGWQTVSFSAFDEGTLVGTVEQGVTAWKAVDVEFDESFSGIDKVVVTGGADFLVDNIDLTTRVTVNPATNYAPLANDDVFGTAAANAVTTNILANDVDPNDDVLELLSVAGVSSGPVMLASGAIVQFSGNGDIIYDPNGAFDRLYSGQNGRDSFTYTVSDGEGGSSEAEVVVRVTGQGTLPNATHIDFDTATQLDAATVSDQGFDFFGGTLVARADGQVLESIDSSITIRASSGDAFDFEFGMMRLLGRGIQTLSIEGYLNGALVGEEEAIGWARSARGIVPDDMTFDWVDEVVLSSDAGLTLDDLSFFI